VARWLGVDVGDARKGFDLALIDGHELLLLMSRLDRTAVAELVEPSRLAVVAIRQPVLLCAAARDEP
jgi:hypothetical protein